MSTQTQRIQTLDRWLRQGRRVVAKEAAKELGVDERTIRRDLKQAMAGALNLPVRYDRSQRAWYYDGETAALPSTLVSASDRLALLLSLRSIEQYRGTPIYENLKALHDRLLATLPLETRTSYAQLAGRIRFEGPPVPPMPADVWHTVLNALDEQTTLSFEYHTGHSGQVRRREVDPYGLIVRHREWYLVGHDHFRKAVRTFFLPRIREVKDTDRTFSVRGGFTLDTYLSTAVDGQQSTGPVHRVVLRFEKEAAHLGEEYVWNETQRLSRDGEGRVGVEFQTGALYEVERQILAWGGRAVVLAPAELRESIARAARQLIDQHEPFLKNALPDSGTMSKRRH